MKTFTSRLNTKWVALGSGLVLGMLFSSVIVQAATTISTGITTAGGYTQSGVSANTFTGATTFSAAGTALSVTNNATVTGNLRVDGTASTTNLQVGVNGSTIQDMIVGYCTLGTANITTASTTYADCTGASSAIDTSYRVFVQATSSLPIATVVTAASSTATAGTIQVRLWGDTGATNISAATVSLSYWAVK